MLQEILTHTPDGDIAGYRIPTAQTPRARLIALHGGGYDHTYWHDEQNPGGSLLLLGAALGFEVIAIDRPGYGGSRAGWPNGISIAAQAAVIGASALADTGAPVFLIGHSMGGLLSAGIAASSHAERFAGIDVAGTPLRYPETFKEKGVRLAFLSDQGLTHMPQSGAAAVREMFFGQDGDFDATMPERTPPNPMPLAEMGDALDAPKVLPGQMERIRIPVRWTAAADERTSETGLAFLDYVAGLLKGSAYAETSLQQNSGHNISQHKVARAYHLRAFAFFEEIMARKR